MKKAGSKKGVELSLNTIIVAVMVIVLLVVVVAFFLFGFKGLSDKIKTTFFGATAGTDRTLALQACANYCEQAALWPNDIRTTSPYCTQVFFIEDKRGVVEVTEEGNPVKYYCYNGDGGEGVNYLDVPCTTSYKIKDGAEKLLGDSGVCPKQ